MKEKAKDPNNSAEFNSRACASLLAPLTKIENLYSLSTDSGHPRICSLNELNKLSETYQTDFAIIAGVDRADPMKIDMTKGSRTIVSIVAKGLPNSKNNPEMYLEEGTVKKYIYFLLQ